MMMILCKPKILPQTVRYEVLQLGNNVYNYGQHMLPYLLPLPPLWIPFLVQTLFWLHETGLMQTWPNKNCSIRQAIKCLKSEWKFVIANLFFYAYNNCHSTLSYFYGFIFFIKQKHAQTWIHMYDKNYSNNFELRKIRVVQYLQEWNDCISWEALYF
jgi:hypothetical protein